MPSSVFDTVLTTISRYNMLRPGDRVAAAVSGGSDSVFLLYALAEIAPNLKATLAGVAHLNHKLRGAASDDDERFVAELAAKVGVPLYRAEARMGETNGNLENASRRARLKFFDRLLQEGAADCIATGHTRDDQAETVLFRMLRGSGLAGLAGILPMTGGGEGGGGEVSRLIRPLLETSREQIREFLTARGIGWREDASNADPRFARNRIRHQLLPRLEREWNPELRQGLDRLADLAGEEERWWAGHIARLLQRLLSRQEALLVDGGIEISADVVARLPKAVSRRLVRHLIRQAGGAAPDFEHVERTIALARGPRGSGSLELPGLGVIRSFGWLRLEPPVKRSPQPEPIPIEARPGFWARYPWAGGTVCLEVVEQDGGAAKSAPAGCVRLKWNGQATSVLLELRGWRSGDYYRPQGSKRDQKLKELFQKARVPSWKRAFWPIVTTGSSILWTRNFGPAAETGPVSAPVSAEDARRGGCEAWLRVWEAFPPGLETGKDEDREEKDAGL